MRRLLILLTCLCLFATGCATDNSVPTDLNIPASLKDVNFEEHLEISIGFWNIQNMVNANHKDEIWEYIETLFNITIKPINFNWSDYNERYLIMGVSDTLPDVFGATTIGRTSENKMIRLSDMLAGNMLSPLPENLSAYPLVEKTINNFKSSLVQPDNKVYTFPRTSFSDPSLSSSDVGMLVRKDWLETLGLSAPTSLDEFINMTIAFAHDDPDGNGIDDTIGYNVNNRLALGKWLMLGIAPDCNVYTWVESEGRYFPSYMLPEFDNVVSTYRLLYEKGGLDPDFYMKKTTDAVYDFARGKLGALEYKSSPAALSEIKIQWNAYHDDSQAFEDYVSLLNIFPAPDGNFYSSTSSSFWSETLFSSSVDDAKMERILYLLNFLMSDEGWFLTRYGLVDEDYEMRNDKYYCLLDTEERTLFEILNNKYPSLSLFSSLASWGGYEADFEISDMNNIRHGEDIMKMSNEALKWNRENTIMVDRPYDFLDLVKEDPTAFINSSVIDEFTKVIIGNDDPVAMWHKVIDSWYENGIEEYINLLNKQADKLK